MREGFGVAYAAWGPGLWWFVPLGFGLGWLLLFSVLAWRWRRGGPCRGWRGGPQPPDAVETLRQRFARGEIDQDEYERRRAVLQAERA
jgi:putative membrane protein